MPGHTDHDTVLGLERLTLDVVVRSDPDRLGELLHPDFAEHGASGRSWTRAEVFEALPADPAPPAGELVDPVATTLAEGVVLLTYRIVGPAGSSLRSSVWVRSAGSWRMRFHQGTPVVSDPTGPRPASAPGP